MFIRFVRNKSHKPHNRRGNKLFGVACVGFAALLVLCSIGRVWKYAMETGKLDKWLGNTAVALYRQLALSEYNIATYKESDSYKNNGGQQVMTKLVESINENNSLYGYINNESVVISFTATDPLYDYKNIVVDEDSGENMEKPQEENTGEASEQNVADNSETDNSEADNSKAGDSETTETQSDYVVPAVSDAGITYTMEQLSDFDFLMAKLYIVPSRALVYESDLVAEDMLSKDMTIQGDNSKPQILIYHTHSQEGFVDSVAGDDNTNIVAVGAYLAKILSEEYGYNVIHCQEHFDIAGGTLDRSKAYTYAGQTIEQILADNPSIDVILDIHRDGLAEGADKLVTNINGKDTAKIMFFNGVSRSSATGDIDYLYNRYKADNLAFSFQLKLTAMECYPEFTRRNYIDAYQYNLQYRQKSVLVEVGAQNNTLQEELNAMEVLAEVLHRVISPDNN